MQPLLWSLINKSYTHCPQGEKDVEINVLLFFSLCFSFHSSPDRQAAKNPVPFREPDEHHRDGDR